MWHGHFSHFDNTVFRLGQKQFQLRRQQRLEAADIDMEEEQRLREAVSQVDQDSPEKDRISRLSYQIEWLKEAGFRSVDHIWHFWMEHFIICRK